MPPIFQKAKLKRESKMTVMFNLASNLLSGGRFFTRNAYKYSLKFSLLVHNLETNRKKYF